MVRFVTRELHDGLRIHVRGHVRGHVRCHVGAVVTCEVKVSRRPAMRPHTRARGSVPGQAKASRGPGLEFCRERGVTHSSTSPGPGVMKDTELEKL